MERQTTDEPPRPHLVGNGVINGTDDTKQRANARGRSALVVAIVGVTGSFLVNLIFVAAKHGVAGIPTAFLVSLRAASALTNFLVYAGVLLGGVGSAAGTKPGQGAVALSGGWLLLRLLTAWAGL
jgi:hypothetical protein